MSPRLNIAIAGEKYLAVRVTGDRYDLGPRYGLLTAQLALALAGKDRAAALDYLRRYTLAVDEAEADRQIRRLRSGQISSSDLDTELKKLGRFSVRVTSVTANTVDVELGQ